MEEHASRGNEDGLAEAGSGEPSRHRSNELGLAWKAAQSRRVVLGRGNGTVGLGVWTAGLAAAGRMGQGHYGGRKASFLATTPVLLEAAMGPLSEDMAGRAGCDSPTASCQVPPSGEALQPGMVTGPNPKHISGSLLGAPLGELLYPLARDSHGRRTHQHCPEGEHDTQYHGSHLRTMR